MIPLETMIKIIKNHTLTKQSVSNGMRNNPVRDHQYYYVYLLQSIKSCKWYTGFTSNLRKRFNEHQDNQSVYTKGRGPFKLIYYEACLNEYDARAREAYLKSGVGRRYLKNRLKRFLSLTGYNQGSAIQFAPATGSP